MNDDRLRMTEEEKYREWSAYIDAGAGVDLPLADYSDYCDWLDTWEFADG